MNVWCRMCARSFLYNGKVIETLEIAIGEPEFVMSEKSRVAALRDDFPRVRKVARNWKQGKYGKTEEGDCV